VVLWTRLSSGDGSARRWSVIVQDAVSGRVVFRRAGLSGADRDHTVKLEATGLQPGAEYRYLFESDGHSSPTGRFRTLPERADDLVLAVVSCSLHPGGLFNAYDAVAKLPRVDAVVHLGDYIYEYGARPQDYGVGVGQQLGRLPDPPHEIVTLADYRRRHAQYKSDPDLQAAHARAAWITVWDDHETANDSWLGGAENHDPDQNEGDWAARKAAALKAYYEWMPIREPAPGRSQEMADRTFRFADIATLHMVETRLLARSKQLNYASDLAFAGGVPDMGAFRAKLNDPARNLLGGTQLGTLTRAVQDSVRAGVTWQVLGGPDRHGPRPGSRPRPPALRRADGRRAGRPARRLPPPRGAGAAPVRPRPALQPRRLGRLSRPNASASMPRSRPPAPTP
jgi:alkaline phosphatase D